LFFPSDFFPRFLQFQFLEFSLLRAPAEACARNEKFEKQLELAGNNIGWGLLWR
jgi:hypothetical protein